MRIAEHIFLDQPPAAVIDAYPLLDRSRPWRPAPEGGFSKAQVWLAPPDYVLKATPAIAAQSAWLSQIPAWVTAAKEAGIEVLPRIYPARNGSLAFESRGILYELMEYRPGRADFQRDPNDIRLQAIMEQLARLHKVWSRRSAMARPMRGLVRRKQALHRGREMLVEAAITLDYISHRFFAWEEIAELAARLPKLLDRAGESLKPLEAIAAPIHPCLCDCWHDHFLFEGNSLTGIIDLSAMKIDHPAIDLARALGSLLPGEKQRWRQAFAWYGEGFPFEWIEIFEESGAVAAGVRWLERIAFEREDFANPAMVKSRVQTVIERLRQIG